MNRIIYYSILIICWSFLCSCASTIYLYDEPELPKNEIATLEVSTPKKFNEPILKIYEVDGKEIKIKKFKTFLKAKEGTYKLNIKIKARWTLYGSSATGAWTETKYINYFYESVVWSALPGHKYKLIFVGDFFLDQVVPDPLLGLVQIISMPID